MRRRKAAKKVVEELKKLGLPVVIEVGLDERVVAEVLRGADLQNIEVVVEEVGGVARVRLR